MSLISFTMFYFDYYGRYIELEQLVDKPTCNSRSPYIYICIFLYIHIFDGWQGKPSPNLFWWFWKYSNLSYLGNHHQWIGLGAYSGFKPWFHPKYMRHESGVELCRKTWDIYFNMDFLIGKVMINYSIWRFQDLRQTHRFGCRTNPECVTTCNFCNCILHVDHEIMCIYMITYVLCVYVT